MANTSEGTAELHGACIPDATIGPEAPAPLFQMVARAASAAACQLDVARLVEVILEQAGLAGAPVAAVFAADVERRELTLLGQRGAPASVVKGIERVTFDAPLVSARAAATRQLQHYERHECSESAMTLTSEVLRRTDMASVLAVPLMAASSLVGILTMARAEDRRFPAEEEAAIRAIADVFAASLRTAQIHERDRAQVESVHLAALAISAPIALPSVLQNIVDQAQTIADASYAALGIVNPEEPDGPFDPWVFSGMTEREAALIGRTPRPVGLLGAVAREGRTIRLKHISEDPRFQGVPSGHPPMTSFLGVPIFSREHVVGNLYLANKPGGGEFSEDDQRAVEMLALHAGIAVEHAREHALLVQEIAQHKRDRDALQESEERFRRLAENAPAVICRYRLGPSSTIEYVSPAIRDVLGHGPEEYYRDARLLCRQVHPFERSLVDTVLRAPDSLSGPLTLRWLHPSGRLVWTESRLVLVRDETGKVTALESITRDITDRKSAEDEIERLLDRLSVRQAWLQTVIESSPVGLVLAEDPAGRRITANREAERLFGRPLRPEGGIEQYIDQVRDPSGAPLARSELLVLQALQGETVAGQERLCRRADGRELPVLVSAAPVLNEHGQVSGAVVVYRDISTLKELERLRTEWTSIVAHDLRQPVQAIAIQASWLAKRAIAPELKVKADRILSAVNELTRMISDLLDASRLEVRQLPLSLEVVDVVALANDVVERMDEELAGRPVRVQSKSEIPPIQADALRLGEVLCNLISNAAKYGYPGTAIDLELEVKAGEISVSVTNQGEGIAPEEMPKLFERFQRTERAAKGRARGVGLGLYITKGLVEAHGGRIGAESTPGRTTTFYFTLPIERAA